MGVFVTWIFCLLNFWMLSCSPLFCLFVLTSLRFFFLLVLPSFVLADVFKPSKSTEIQLFSFERLKRLKNFLLFTDHVCPSLVIQLHIPSVFKHAIKGLLKIIILVLAAQGNQRPNVSFVLFLYLFFLDAKFDILNCWEMCAVLGQVRPIVLNLTEGLPCLHKFPIVLDHLFPWHYRVRKSR